MMILEFSADHVVSNDKTYTSPFTRRTEPSSLSASNALSSSTPSRPAWGSNHHVTYS